MNNVHIKIGIYNLFLPEEILKKLLTGVPFIDRVVKIDEDEFNIYLEEGCEEETCRKEISELLKEAGYIPAMHFVFYE